MLQLLMQTPWLQTSWKDSRYERVLLTSYIWKAAVQSIKTYDQLYPQNFSELSDNEDTHQNLVLNWIIAKQIHN